MKDTYERLVTEKSNPRTRNIDEISIENLLKKINSEDRKVPRAVNKTRKEIAQAVKMIVTSLQDGGRLFFVGAGTSGRLGVIEAAECPPTFNTSPSLVRAVMAGGAPSVFRSKEGAEDDAKAARRALQNQVQRGDVVVGIAASGLTPFVLEGLKVAKQKKAKRILVTCNKIKSRQSPADCIIAPIVGPEVICGSTRLKAGTATKLVLNMLTVTSMVQLGKVYQNWMVDLQPKSQKLKARALRLIQHLGEVSEKEALKCFQNSKKNVKVAILMAKTNLPLAAAKRKLQTSKGFLKKAIES